MSITNRTKRLMILIAGVALLLLTGLVLLGYHLYASEWPGGMRPSYVAADYDARLTREAATATPLIAALDRYHREHSFFPAQAADIDSYLPNSATPPAANADEILGWRYQQGEHGSSYVLSRKLGWDPTLQYRGSASTGGSSGTWVFDPGDGSAERTIILKP